MAASLFYLETAAVNLITEARSGSTAECARPGHVRHWRGPRAVSLLVCTGLSAPDRSPSSSSLCLGVRVARMVSAPRVPHALESGSLLAPRVPHVWSWAEACPEAGLTSSDEDALWSGPWGCVPSGTTAGTTSCLVPASFGEGQGSLVVSLTPSVRPLLMLVWGSMREY